MAEAYLPLLRLVCLASGAAMHIVPLTTMSEIRSARSTLNFHIAPYASTLLNHLINGYYAVIRDDGALMLHRTAGVLANAYYVYTFMSYCPPARAADSWRFCMRVFFVFVFMLSELHVLLPILGLSSSLYTHLAFFAAMTGIGLAASPLATVREVFAQRDSSSLPFGLCIMVTVQCTSWTLYGYLKEDWSTFANNAVGVVLGSLQLALIFGCPNKRRLASAGKAKSGDNEPLVDDSSDSAEKGMQAKSPISPLPDLSAAAAASGSLGTVSPSSSSGASASSLVGGATAVSASSLASGSAALHAGAVGSPTSAMAQSLAGAASSAAAAGDDEAHRLSAGATAISSDANASPLVGAPGGAGVGAGGFVRSRLTAGPIATFDR